MAKENRMILNKKEVKNIKLTNFTQFIKENEDYIEYIKEHDKKAYEKYLSYSTYLKH